MIYLHPLNIIEPKLVQNTNFFDEKIKIYSIIKIGDSMIIIILVVLFIIWTMLRMASISDKNIEETKKKQKKN